MVDARPDLSVIVPVKDDPVNLQACLHSLERSEAVRYEVIVVDDGSRSAKSADVAKQAGARVLRVATTRGPANARNVGAQVAEGEILVFLDADVEAHPDALQRVLDVFAQEPDVEAVFGSYDDAPSGQNLLSQYRNLLHHYTHQHANREAFTFWSGCGAIRRKTFERVGGFEDRFHHPSIEDIELGQRVHAGGGRILLCREIQVRHRKVWRFVDMVRCDLTKRGIPWMRELLRLGRIPTDLNLRYSDRFLTAFAGILTVLLAWACWQAPLWWLAPPWILACLTVADWVSSPGSAQVRTRWRPLRWMALLEVAGLAALVYWTPQVRGPALFGAGVLCLFLALRWSFYRLLVQVRGYSFCFFAFQAHVLFYWTCGISLIVGFAMHWIRPLEPIPVSMGAQSDSDETASVDGP